MYAQWVLWEFSNNSPISIFYIPRIYVIQYGQNRKQSRFLTQWKYELVGFRKRLEGYGDKRFNPLNIVEKNDVGYQISSFCWVTVKMHFADFSGMSSNWFKVMQELGIILSTGTKTTFHLTFVAIHPCLSNFVFSKNRYVWYVKQYIGGAVSYVMYDDRWMSIL